MSRSVTGGVGLYTTGANGKRDNFLGYITINGFLSQGYEWFNQFSYALPSDSNALIRVMAPVRRGFIGPQPAPH